MCNICVTVKSNLLSVILFPVILLIVSVVVMELLLRGHIVSSCYDSDTNVKYTDIFREASGNLSLIKVE